MPNAAAMNSYDPDKYDKPDHTPIVLIGVKRMECLLSSKFTLAELCSLQLELATTASRSVWSHYDCILTHIQMVHEIMHAVVLARHYDEPHLQARVASGYKEPVSSRRIVRSSALQLLTVLPLSS